MKRILLVLITFLIVTACSSVRINERPQDIREEIWSQGLQIAIIIKNNVEQEKKEELKGFAKASGIYGRYKHIEDVTESEKQLVETIGELYTQSLFYGIFGTDKESNKNYYKSLSAVEKIYGKEVLDYSNYDSKVIEPILVKAMVSDLEEEQTESENSPIELFKKEHQISLDAKTVQFDMANNLDKSFVISGSLKLDNYFNYGFDDEKNYFSAFITPDGGSYSDGWYVYFQRDSYKELFNELLSNEKNVIVEAEIPSSYYEDGQGNMALVTRVQW